MREEKKPIVTMKEFLEHMFFRDFLNHEKTGARVEYWKGQTEQPKVIEFFDDGRGHSGAFSCDETPVELAIFKEALREYFIEPKPIMGGVSSYEFVLTRHGEGTLFELREKERVAKTTDTSTS